jgi:hypothetical protein
MGLLDDAIREHLDLKRRRGADPTEIERAEREALGPVRRIGEESEPPDSQVASYDDEGHNDETGGSEHDAAPHLDWIEPDDVEEPEPMTAEHEPMTHSSERGSASEPEDDSAVDLEPAAPVRAPRDKEEDEDLESWTRSTGPERGGAETVEYDVEDALESEHDKERGEDVLEETPEFLQDTPDHDRLWFEQKPPRDFDFDG